MLELIDSDYTFLNAKLAELYGIKDVTGSQMRKVSLPKDSPRGGVLTHASILLVTSNPTRTSPVKRGQFILDNLLGTPAPPPPPDVPPLESRRRTSRAGSRRSASCWPCIAPSRCATRAMSRMDPLGLALENFNALGLWRDKESGQAIDASGKLLTGESFHDVRELEAHPQGPAQARFLPLPDRKTAHLRPGRGLDYHDVETVDQIVERLDREGGRFSALLMGVIESAPFQKRRSVSAAEPGHRPGLENSVIRHEQSHEIRPFAKCTRRHGGPPAKQPAAHSCAAWVSRWPSRRLSR